MPTQPLPFRPNGTAYHGGMSKGVQSCRACGCDEFGVGYISRQGLCEDCGIALAVKSAVEMADKQGYAWSRWVDAVGKIVDQERGGRGY